MWLLHAGNVDGELIRQERTIKIAAALGIEAEAQEVGAIRNAVDVKRYDHACYPGAAGEAGR